MIPAGGTFSFNEAVGERTAAFGYAKAVVIRDGMIAEGTGGGACQVASTLHAAALLSNLDVSRRAPHSRPSAYIRMGLDATVSFGVPGAGPRGSGPAIDLKLSNPLAGAVTIHARASRGTLDVWFDGASLERPDVTVTTEIVETIAYPRVIERDRSVVDDAAHVKSFGIPGYRVKRTREVRTADGAVIRDVRVDVYAPTAEVLRVAKSFDEARLRPSDEGESAAPPAQRVDDLGAIRPVLVQLRPSKIVTLDNRGR